MYVTTNTPTPIELNLAQAILMVTVYVVTNYAIGAAIIMAFVASPLSIGPIAALVLGWAIWAYMNSSIWLFSLGVTIFVSDAVSSIGRGLSRIFAHTSA